MRSYAFRRSRGHVRVLGCKMFLDMLLPMFLADPKTWWPAVLLTLKVVVAKIIMR